MASQQLYLLSNLGYNVASSKSNLGKFRWWLNTNSDGESVPPRDCSEKTFDTEDAAWTDAKADAVAAGTFQLGLEKFLRETQADQGGEASFEDWVRSTAEEKTEYGHEEAKEYLALRGDLSEKGAVSIPREWLAEMLDYVQRFADQNDEPMDGSCRSVIANVETLLASPSAQVEWICERQRQ